MTEIHSLGFPRMGQQRELKFALESYWAGKTDQAELLETGRQLRERHWGLQAGTAGPGKTLVPVGDFAWYDHILEWTTTLGAVPARFGQSAAEPVTLDTLFRMGRGRAPSGTPVAACEMTKWFDTNYHYIVPELTPGQEFRIARDDLFEQIEEALALGHAVKPVIPGPLTWLWLGKGDAYSAGPHDAGKLELLDRLLPVYARVLERVAQLSVEWVQIDEPILALDLPAAWQEAFPHVYQALAGQVKILLATYFGGITHHLDVLANLPVQGVHVDLVRAPEQAGTVAAVLDGTQVFSAGVIDGRNIWRTDLDKALEALQPLHNQFKERLWLAPSCSLLHVPIDLDAEHQLDSELKSWMSFAVQKLDELHCLAELLNNSTDESVNRKVREQGEALQRRRQSSRIHHPEVKSRLGNLRSLPRERTPFAERIARQRKALDLPDYPTTTIGSFPQTPEIRRLRRDWRKGVVSDAAYEKQVRAEIESVLRFQEEVGLDVLVHGEPERNDMVEYFGELLGGFAFTEQGWVQSYGSRCVKPPVIYGDVLRPAPMTVGWSSYAQSLTDKPLKGMLTGPVTLLQWSFVRDDQPREDTCRQLALALRDEVSDLQEAGIRIIQIDEPAFREGLPLRRSDWQQYLDWAVDCFRIASSHVADETQVHTHMCYSEFNDIIEAIAAMDADVITIETSRSRMELLEAFEDFSYPNDIGPGVYDIHSPNQPDVKEMVELIQRAAARLPKERLWVNPDCGLKTRAWAETRGALEAMVAAARSLRQMA